MLMLLAFCVTGQEHPFLAKFELKEGDGWVSVDWTMKAGSTCDGTRVMRSEDGVYFETVGRIEGICGDVAHQADYRYVDLDIPEMVTLYYRLDLGLNGPSEAKRIDLVRLNTVQHRFQPNPVADEGILFLRVEHDEQVEIQFFDVTGREVRAMKASGGRHVVDVSGWPAGLYFYDAQAGAAMRFTGRFIVQ